MTAFILVFGVALLLAVLTSALASRSALSTTTVFLVVGLVAGPLVLDVLSFTERTVEHAAEVALFAVLFTDGQHARWRTVRGIWAPCARVLLIGMPLTFGIIAGLAHLILGVGWVPALVLGAVLAPTDPVFASALVGREDVPRRVRHLLNIESGLNDGIALPVVLALVGVAGGHPERWSTDPLPLLAEVGLGLAVGVVVPLAIRVLLVVPKVGAVPALQPLGPLATALLVYGICTVVDANQFLAAFVAGSVVATVRPPASESFRQTGELVSELAKGGALLAFATLPVSGLFRHAGWAGLGLAVLVVVVSRPAPVLLVMLGTPYSLRERLAVAWFGPKGFASVAYAVIVGLSGMDAADTVLAVVAVTVLLSVVAHSSTDVAVAARLEGETEADARREAADGVSVTSPP